MSNNELESKVKKLEGVSIILSDPFICCLLTSASLYWRSSFRWQVCYKSVTSGPIDHWYTQPARQVCTLHIQFLTAAYHARIIVKHSIKMMRLSTVGYAEKYDARCWSSIFLSRCKFIRGSNTNWQSDLICRVHLLCWAVKLISRAAHYWNRGTQEVRNMVRLNEFESRLVTLFKSICDHYL